MPFKVQDESGKEIEVYSPEEVNVHKQEVETFKAKALENEKAVTEARAEAEKYKAVIAEKNDNFKRFKDMTEEEKKTLTAKDIENIKRAEAAEAKALELEDKFNKDVESRKESAKTKAIEAYAHGDEELKKKLLESYDLVKLDGTDEDSIKRKVELSWNMLGLGKPKVNPFNQSYDGGDAPNKGLSDKFVETDKGKAGLAAMGEIKF